ncbi:MAG: DEAD/DEAH box helicase family protein [Chloroflexota bacterium]
MQSLKTESIGTLGTLRGEIGLIPDIRFRLCEFRPASGMTPAIEQRYHANILSVVRQLRYSVRSENAIDLVLFVNGIPVATSELKNELTGSSVRTAERQYRTDRAPAGEPLLTFLRGAVVHFAVDERLVSMTTELQNDRTEFLPFNRGRNGGRGNPEPELGEFATSYLWEHVWQRDLWLEILGRFLHVQVTKKKDGAGRETERRRLIFPRWHQLEAVRMLVADARENGPGQNYLIQHSAGSGKSNTIAWSAHRFATLHGADDRPVFDSVIVVTDRVVLDRQLQDTIKQFESQPGMVTTIDGTSRQLAAALQGGARIIVTTIQKFSTEHLRTLEDRRGQQFAIIIDEAHSGQSGETADALHSVLSNEANGLAPVEDAIARVQAARGPQVNISYLAFTATPRQVTLERFGRRGHDGRPLPFHLYTMRQAIEEGFILDVLANYMTYETCYSIEKAVEEDPVFEGRRGAQRIARFVSLHPHQIAQKIEVIVEHFRHHIAPRLGGQAKAMVVTSSREHAVRYFYSMRDYIAEHRYTDVSALVAFSGGVPIDGQEPVTEPELNGISEKGLPGAFDGAAYNVLLVAEKYQTGFDQPKLVAMYVDKSLTGLQAVQTLSRLNRTYPGKNEVFVLDFRNTTDEIQIAFKPFFEVTRLAETTDPNQIYTLRTRLLSFNFVAEADARRFAEILFGPGTDADKRPILEGFARAAVARFEAEPDEQVQDEFRQLGRSFCRFYTFLAQVWPVRDIDLERLHGYMTWVNRLLRNPEGDDEPEITADMVQMTAFNMTGNEPVAASLQAGDTIALPPITEFGANRWTEEERRTLSEIIEAFNARHGLNIRPEDALVLERADEDVRADPQMQAIIANNPRDIALREFAERFADAASEIFERDRNFETAFVNDGRVREQLAALFFDRARRNAHAGADHIH